MYSELVILTEKVADLCPEIRRASRNTTRLWVDRISVLLLSKLLSTSFVAFVLKIDLWLQFIS